MNNDELKKQFPYIKPKSENWYYDEIAKRYIHKSKISSYLANKIVFEFDKNKKGFNQIDSFKQKRK